MNYFLIVQLPELYHLRCSVQEPSLNSDKTQQSRLNVRFDYPLFIIKPGRKFT